MLKVHLSTILITTATYNFQCSLNSQENQTLTSKSVADNVALKIHYISWKF